MVQATEREKALLISVPILMKKAKLLFPQLYPGADKKIFSQHWILWCFCKRHGLKIQIQRESAVSAVSTATSVHDFLA